MHTLILDALHPQVRTRIEPFFREILSSCPEGIHALAVTGSAVTPDFQELSSNINSVIILNKMHLDFLHFLAPLGRKYHANHLGTPLVMTAQYIEDSLDVFPMEFLDLKLLHQTVYGADVFGALTIQPEHLRLQCEREIKTRLLALWQGYIAHLGQKDAIAGLLLRSAKDLFPLLRGVLFLKGTKPPVSRRDVVAAVEELIPIDRSALELVLSFQHPQGKPTEDVIREAFERHYRNLEVIRDTVEPLLSGSR